MVMGSRLGISKPDRARVDLNSNGVLRRQSPQIRCLLTYDARRHDPSSRVCRSLICQAPASSPTLSLSIGYKVLPIVASHSHLFIKLPFHHGR